MAKTNNDIQIKVKLSCAVALGPLACLVFFGIPEQWAALNSSLIFSLFAFAVLEELAFRGFIQTSILKHTKAIFLWGITYANLITSILFSIAHMINISFDKAILVFVPSLIFGYFRERYEGVAVPIALHGFYNLNYIAFS